MSKITVVSTAKGDRLKIDGKFVDFFTGRDTPQDIAMGVRQLLKKG